jgi:hypothetical protein
MIGDASAGGTDCKSALAFPFRDGSLLRLCVSLNLTSSQTFRCSLNFDILGSTAILPRSRQA